MRHNDILFAGEAQNNFIINGPKHAEFSDHSNDHQPVTKKLSTREILQDNLARRAPSAMSELKILLHNIRSMHNVGAVFRSSDAFGVSEILISGYTPTPPRPEITKTAIGAEEFVEWSYHEDEVKLLKELSHSGYTIIGLEQTDNSRLLTGYEVKENTPYCLVMGNEVTGIDDKLMPYIDDFVAIPQFGHKHSLNVSVAAGVVMYAFLDKFTALNP